MGVTLRGISIPTRGSENTPGCLMQQKLEISLAWSRLLGSNTDPFTRTFLFPFFQLWSIWCWPTKIGLVYSTLEKFENGIFFLKTNQMFFLRRRNLETQQSTVILDFVRGKLGHAQGNHLIFANISFSKSSVVSLHRKTQSQRFQIPPVWRPLTEKHVFSNGFNTVHSTPNRRNKAASSYFSGVRCPQSVCECRVEL